MEIAQPSLDQPGGLQVLLQMGEEVGWLMASSCMGVSEHRYTPNSSHLYKFHKSIPLTGKLRINHWL